MTTHTTASSATPLTPPSAADKQQQIAQCIGAILAGQPLPEAFRPAPPTIAPVSSLEAGFARILGTR